MRARANAGAGGRTKKENWGTGTGRDGKFVCVVLGEWRKGLAVGFRFWCRRVGEEWRLKQREIKGI